MSTSPSGLTDFARRTKAALAQACETLWREQTAEGHWCGELSSSALSTATAVTALALVQRETGRASLEIRPTISPVIFRRGLDWLAQHANTDGGWGDTTRSRSNLSTTTLAWAAFAVVPAGEATYRATTEGAARWITQHAGGVAPDVLAPAIIARYGKDRTFSVPILTLCALSGRLGTGPAAWHHVIPLPFELAACPHQWFAALRLPVVSYALPALIAMGQARHHHAPSRNPLTRWARQLARERTLKILTRIQPASGGFLEATPLTSFVTMSLAGIGLADHVVARRGVEFLLQSQRLDGSWPIDTNLATWVTTLAINALSASSDSSLAHVASGRTHHESRLASFAPSLRSWLLAQQHRVEHPYTHAAPGGWAWTDLPGGVPDADDTAGALLALRRLGPLEAATRAAGERGVNWLLELQNRDGGIPTFCRGWGALPFDQSSADITAHAMRAWLAWRDDLPATLQRRTTRAMQRAAGFLARTQRADGSWVPLWFGHEQAPGELNPVYGTSRVLSALSELAVSKNTLPPTVSASRDRAVTWLVKQQNMDGGWGGAAGIASSVEETALAVEALAGAAEALPAEASAASMRGATWLVERVESGAWREPAPIGFYFAKLWYYERLYPLIFTVGALEGVLQRVSR